MLFFNSNVRSVHSCSNRRPGGYPRVEWKLFRCCKEEKKTQIYAHKCHALPSLLHGYVSYDTEKLESIEWLYAYLSRIS